MYGIEREDEHVDCSCSHAMIIKYPVCFFKSRLLTLERLDENGPDQTSVGL